MSGERLAWGETPARLLDLYDRALPQVYGYLLSRCGQRALAEDLTAETFLAAVDAVRATPSPPLTTGWLIGVARHKLSDHWRRQAREERTLPAPGQQVAEDLGKGPVVEVEQACGTLAPGQPLSAHTPIVVRAA